MSIDAFGKFAQLLLDEGRAGGSQIVEPETIALMFTNQLPSTGGLDAFQFGLGFGIAEALPPNADGTPSKSFYWGGAAGTTFWVNPTLELGLVFITQVIGAPVRPMGEINRIVFGSFE